jgi:osmoprotectant transport system substrate-binding protein
MSSLLACGGTDPTGDGPSDSIRIASFDFAESELVAELYAQVLEANGFEVTRLGAIGPREVVAPAMEQGQIDLVPEYVGTAGDHFGAGDDDLASLIEALEPRGLVPLEPAPAVDVNVLVVTESMSRERGLASISDLADIAATIRLGGPVECPDRPLCLLGLRSTYGLEFARFIPQRTLAVTAEALVRDEIDVGVMFSTAAEITTGPFVVLDDDLGLQPADNVVPVIRRETLDRWGTAVADALDAMSSRLTTIALQLMNRSIQDGTTIPDAAAVWLAAIGLVEG